MKVAQLWEQYQHYTRDLTDHGRKLGFAGAAICWVFKSDKFTFPASIYWALLFFVAYFLADIFQGFFGALTIRFFAEQQEAKLWEKSRTIEGKINKPRWVDAPAYCFFVLKCLFLITGFAFIGWELLKRLSI